MSVVTKRSSIPVATLAITLLSATLPAQCEKLSTLKPDSVHRRQTVLHTSSGSIRWYQSDEMWLYQLSVSVQYCVCMYGENSESVCVCGRALRISFFRGTPDDSGPGRGLTPNHSPWTPPSWDTTYSQVTGGVFLHRHRCDNSGNFSDFMMSFLLPMQCAAWVVCACMHV